MAPTKSPFKSVNSIFKVQSVIFHLRGKQVILDRELAMLYGVETKILNKAVKRNRMRFPEDFMFQLSPSEYENLRFHFGTSKQGGRRYRPYAFTEHGILMLSSVLKSENSVQVNIQIMRVFVQMRRYTLTEVNLKRKIDGIEQKYDAQFKVVFDALRQLISPPVPRKKGGVGFTG